MKNAALIGLGMVSRTFADAFANTTTMKLVGVHARTAQSRTAYLAKYPGPKDYASIGEIARDPNVDFAILTTPPNARLEIVEMLAAHGKHILMEKPVERTLEAATELCQICEGHGITLGIVLQHRTRPSAIKLRQLIDTGDLGALQMAEIRVPWWRDQNYYNEPGRGTYDRDGGGVLLSQAIHTLDLALSLTGPATGVTAMTATTGLHQMETEDMVAAGLRFANGAVGSLFTTTAAFPGHPESISLYFDRASAILEGSTLTLHHHSGEVETFGAKAATGSGADPMAFSSDRHRAIIEDFVDALSNDRPPMIPGRAALEVHRLIKALETSGKTGTTTQI